MVELGDSLLLEQEVAGRGGGEILAGIRALPIPAGAGATSTTVMLDTTHSSLSTLTALRPSPDWFVGVSGVELCGEEGWRNSLTRHLHPLGNTTISLGVATTITKLLSCFNQWILQCLSGRRGHGQRVDLHCPELGDSAAGGGGGDHQPAARPPRRQLLLPGQDGAPAHRDPHPHQGGEHCCCR